MSRHESESISWLWTRRVVLCKAQPDRFHGFIPGGLNRDLIEIRFTGNGAEGADGREVGRADLHLMFSSSKLRGNGKFVGDWGVFKELARPGRSSLDVFRSLGGVNSGRNKGQDQHEANGDQADGNHNLYQGETTGVGAVSFSLQTVLHSLYTIA